MPQFDQNYLLKEVIFKWVDAAKQNLIIVDELKQRLNGGACSGLIALIAFSENRRLFNQYNPDRNISRPLLLTVRVANSCESRVFPKDYLEMFKKTSSWNEKMIDDKPFNIYMNKITRAIEYAQCFHYIDTEEGEYQRHYDKLQQKLFENDIPFLPIEYQFGFVFNIDELTDSIKRLAKPGKFIRLNSTTHVIGLMFHKDVYHVYGPNFKGF